eukprot:5475419-Heterocapsa_arctica.AAC.1
MGAYRIARHLCRCVLVALLAAPAEVMDVPGRVDIVLVLTSRPCWGFVAVALPPRMRRWWPSCT